MEAPSRPDTDVPGLALGRTELLRKPKLYPLTTPS
jgi:hypothetical protein